jgi:hypothetical protein
MNRIRTIPRLERLDMAPKPRVGPALLGALDATALLAAVGPALPTSPGANGRPRAHSRALAHARKRKPMRRLLILAPLVVALAVPATAAADQPTIQEQTIHRSIANFLACSDFTISGDFDITRIVFTFYDSSGTPIRTVIHVHAEGTLTNTATGKTLVDEGNQIITTDLLTGEVIVVGPARVDTAPGEGVVFAQVGRVVRENGQVVEIDGRNDILEGNLGPLCAYMAAP